MRSSWPARLLPVFQALAEGGWLAVVYAAIQVATGDEPRVGVLELALLAGAGMAWARRRRWRSPVVEAAGLPLLALAGGAAGWFLDPAVRVALVGGPRAAGRGAPRAGLAGRDRGRARRAPRIAPTTTRRCRTGSCASPSRGSRRHGSWGRCASHGALRDAFTASAFVSTMVFAVGRLRRAGTGAPGGGADHDRERLAAEPGLARARGRDQRGLAGDRRSRRPPCWACPWPRSRRPSSGPSASSFCSPSSSPRRSSC